MKLVASLTWWVDALSSSTRTVDPSVTFTGCQTEAEMLERARSIFDLALSRLSDSSSSPMDVTDAKHLLFRAKALKKWKFASHVSASRKSEAFDGFASRNEEAKSMGVGCRSSIRYIMRQLLSHWLPEIPATVTGRFGPGACAERLTHLQRYRRLHEWVQQSPHWPEAPLGVPDVEHVTARLCAVPKDWYRDRLITVEPAYGTFVQQYVRELLLESVHAGPLRGTSMDQLYVDAPQIQRRLALRASREKRNATIDLKDASDRISWDLVRDVFPPWVVRYLEVTRSESFVRPEPDAQPVQMYIYAGMGNATTFVVESLLFKAYVEAVARHEGLRARASVFGDDVVTTSDLARMMTECGSDPFFVVNTSKSFWGDSPLRESCGIFAYNGVDISVPKVDGYSQSWEGRQGLADLFRNLEDFPLLQLEIASLGALPNWERVVPGYPSISTSLVPFDAAPATRWNHHYQRLEYHLMVREPRLRRIPLWDGGASRGLAAAWLTATLCGMFGSDDLQGRYAMVPEGTYRDHLRWLPTA